MSAAEAAHRWVEIWARAWPIADVDDIAALYHADAIIQSSPFREHQAPPDYVAWAFGEQAAAECRFGAPIVSGDRAAVAWWAVITSIDGSEETVAGTSLLRFDPNGLVVEQRDAWAGAPGRHELPGWAAAAI